MDVSRRDLIKLGTTAAAASGLLAAQTAQAQAPAGGVMRAPTPIGFNPADPVLKFDLVIANADVMDPSQRLRTKADVAVKSSPSRAVVPGVARRCPSRSHTDWLRPTGW